MTHDPLSWDQNELERRLSSRSGGAPSPTLRSRVLLAVNNGLRQGESPHPQMTWWSYAATVAAAAVVLLNLSIAAVSVTSFMGQRPDVQPAEVAEEIQRALPELPASEAKRMAVTMSAMGQVSPIPMVHGTGKVTGKTDGVDLPE